MDMLKCHMILILILAINHYHDNIGTRCDIINKKDKTINYGVMD